MARTRGSAKKPARCPGCASRKRSGMRISTGLPRSSARGVAEQLLGLRVDEHDVAVAVDDHDGVRRRLEQAPELRLAGLQLAQAPEHRRVTLADGDHRFVLGSMHHHLDGNQHAVLAPANGFYGDRTALRDLAQADRRLRRGASSGTVRSAHPPADSLFRRVAEHRLCTAIPGQNPALLRYRQQRIRRHIQKAPGKRSNSRRSHIVRHRCPHARFTAPALHAPYRARPRRRTVSRETPRRLPRAPVFACLHRHGR